MVVHVNPYDTGFDENSHVMRFSAIARQIQSAAPNKVTLPFAQRFDSLKNTVLSQKKNSMSVPVMTQDKALDDREAEEMEMIEQEFEVEEMDPEEEDEEDLDPLVVSLFDEIKSLRFQVSTPISSPLVTSELKLTLSIAGGI